MRNGKELFIFEDKYNCCFTLGSDQWQQRTTTAASEAQQQSVSWDSIGNSDLQQQQVSQQQQQQWPQQGNWQQTSQEQTSQQQQQSWQQQQQQVKLISYYVVYLTVWKEFTWLLCPLCVLYQGRFQRWLLGCSQITVVCYWLQNYGIRICLQYHWLMLCISGW